MNNTYFCWNCRRHRPSFYCTDCLTDFHMVAS